MRKKTLALTVLIGACSIPLVYVTWWMKERALWVDREVAIGARQIEETVSEVHVEQRDTKPLTLSLTYTTTDGQSQAMISGPFHANAKNRVAEVNYGSVLAIVVPVISAPVWLFLFVSVPAMRREVCGEPGS